MVVVEFESGILRAASTFELAWSTVLFSFDREAANLKTIAALNPDDVAARASFDEDAVEALKFHECLPPSLQQEVLRHRSVRKEVLMETLTTATHPVYIDDAQRSPQT